MNLHISDLDLHLRLNAGNKRHRQIIPIVEPVKRKHKTALFVAAMEAYLEKHPYGVDYQELEQICKESYHSFQPKVPIQSNLQKQRESEPFVPPAVQAKPESLENKSAQSLDRAIDLYNLDEDE